ncbi:MAG TPA: hypothetical protein VIL29_02615 [Pseudothermotoga sp.]|uniref:hypothetical protein n=1 Tax=Thermotoga profunda TaxID=1508420 RepID=UPI000597CE59|nr:hypothetical protein [Thermotoga profunda]
MHNLDFVCVKIAQEIVSSSGDEKKKLENNLRKALGVLQEDGVYAMFLWLEDKDKTVREKLTGLLNEPEIRRYLLNDSARFSRDFAAFCRNLAEVAKDIDKLLFMKRIIERILIYALYHSKIG